MPPTKYNAEIGDVGGMGEVRVRLTLPTGPGQSEEVELQNTRRRQDCRQRILPSTWDNEYFKPPSLTHGVGDLSLQLVEFMTYNEGKEL